HFSPSELCKLGIRKDRTGWTNFPSCPARSYRRRARRQDRRDEDYVVVLSRPAGAEQAPRSKSFVLPFSSCRFRGGCVFVGAAAGEPHPVDAVDLAGDDDALSDDGVLHRSLEGFQPSVQGLLFGVGAALAAGGVAAAEFSLDELELERPDWLAVGEGADVFP